MFVVGVAGRPHRSVLLTSDIGRDFHIGAEVSVMKYMSLRTGWSKDLEGLDSGRFAAGFSARWGPTAVDYAYQDHSMLDATHTVGLSFDFALAPKLVIADLMFFEDNPDIHSATFEQARYDGGDTDFPARADELRSFLEETGATVRLEKPHPIVGIVRADWS